MKIKKDHQLKERVLSEEFLTDWVEKLKMTFLDFDLKFSGGESSNEAVKRIMKVLEKILSNEYENIILVTHGNLMSLLLNHFNNEFGFEESINLSNPDVYHIKFENNRINQQRIWE